MGRGVDGAKIASESLDTPTGQEWKERKRVCWKPAGSQKSETPGVERAEVVIFACATYSQQTACIVIPNFPSLSLSLYPQIKEDRLAPLHPRRRDSRRPKRRNEECRLFVALQVGRGYPPALSLRAKGSLASLEPAPPEVLKRKNLKTGTSFKSTKRRHTKA